MNTTALVSPGHRFWPAAAAAQADYEALRAHVLATGAPPESLVAARFACRGLPGLIAWPSAEPVFDAALLGAARPPWSPHTDPRLDALAAGFALLLSAGREDAGAAARPRPPTRPSTRSRSCPDESRALRTGVHRQSAGQGHHRVPAHGAARTRRRRGRRAGRRVLR